MERDTTENGVRPGAPHGLQLHNILGRAQRHLCQLIPGFADAFLSAGGQRANVAAQTHVFELGVTMPERDLGLEIWSARKSVIDQVVRRSLADLNVHQQFGHRADDVVVTGGRIVGVRVDGAVVEADLVVDAMGAKSPVVRWLGEPPPPVEEYIVRQWYTTMPVRRPAALVGCPDFWLTFPTYPRTRGGLVSPIDERTWNISLSGGSAEEPPRRPDEFVAYAGTLEDPAIGRLVMAGRPAGTPHTFRKPVATWRRYDSATHAPTGLLSVGDAVADLNPLVGQGISVAAWQIAHLARLLAETDDIGELTVRFRLHGAESVNAAWNLTTLFDPGHGEVTLSEAEWQRIVYLVGADPVAHRRYVEVWHLLRPASDLHRIAALVDASIGAEGALA